MSCERLRKTLSHIQTSSEPFSRSASDSNWNLETACALRRKTPARTPEEQDIVDIFDFKWEIAKLRAEQQIKIITPLLN